MFKLKPLSSKAIPEALAKVERYRLLNEPWEAESICLDILETDPNNQEATIALLLTRTDQFGTDSGAVARARDLLPKIESAYHRAYYAGVIAERRGKSLLKASVAGAGPVVYDWLRQAMESYEEAERARPAGNDNAVLRWNTCARIIMQHSSVRPAETPEREMMLE